MNTEATTGVKCVLDKPLHELTENDISQLTREDCRRYLKEKGMRRPSWNKSQAIQQVISLKSLLEPPTTTTTTTTTCSKPPIITTTATTSSSSLKELSPIDNDSAEGKLPTPGPSRLGALKQGDCCPSPSNTNAISVRRTEAPHLPIGQMRIFYSGKVNVYDEVPADKQAKAMMHLGASPIQLCQDEPSSENLGHWSNPCRLCTPNVKFNVPAKDVSVVQSAMTDAEGHTNRQVSLHRYFEKKKDRGKFKKKKIGSCAPGLEMFMNHQMRDPAINGQITKCNSSSPCQLGIPGMVHGLTGKQLKNPPAGPVDLNDKA